MIRSIQLWLVIVSLEMVDGNLSSVKRKLEQLVGAPVRTSQLVNRLYKVRGDLVHRKFAVPEDDDLKKADILARLFLKARIGEEQGSSELEQIFDWTNGVQQ